MRTANGLGIFLAAMVVTPVFADDSTAERDFLPTRSGQPSTLWSGVAPSTSPVVASRDTMSGTGQDGSEPAAVSRTKRLPGNGRKLATNATSSRRVPGSRPRSGVGSLRSASSAVATDDTGQDRVGAGSGEPDQESAAGERPEARDRRDFLPTRSGRPSTFWTGSR